MACTAPVAQEEPADGAEACAPCHLEYAEELSRSAHGRSAESPLLAALLPEVETAWGVGARARCEGCHVRSEVVDAVVSCALCHHAVGNRGGDGSVVIDPSLPVATAREETSAPHDVRQTDLLRAATLCGSCHELTGPELFVEPTLSEHEASDMAQAGLTCADCHLPEREADGLSEPGHRHDFVGMDPPWGAPPAEAAGAAEDTLALLRAGLRLSLREDAGELVVTLENVGASHSVPTGATWLREIWVELELERADGIEMTRVISLGGELTLGGEPVTLITEADSVQEHALASGELREVRVDARGVRSATARLRARAVRPELLDALDLTSRIDEVPTHEVASQRYEPAR